MNDGSSSFASPSRPRLVVSYRPASTSASAARAPDSDTANTNSSSLAIFAITAKYRSNSSTRSAFNRSHSRANASGSSLLSLSVRLDCVTATLVTSYFDIIFPNIAVDADASDSVNLCSGSSPSARVNARTDRSSDAVASSPPSPPSWSSSLLFAR